jgi:hypothetical protein
MENLLTVDVYAIPCEVRTQLQLAYFRVMVSFLKHAVKRTVS